jgi:hypothetical protein
MSDFIRPKRPGMNVHSCLECNHGLHYKGMNVVLPSSLSLFARLSSTPKLMDFHNHVAIGNPIGSDWYPLWKFWFILLSGLLVAD